MAEQDIEVTKEERVNAHLLKWIKFDVGHHGRVWLNQDSDKFVKNDEELMKSYQKYNQGLDIFWKSLGRLPSVRKLELFETGFIKNKETGMYCLGPIKTRFYLSPHRGFKSLGGWSGIANALIVDKKTMRFLERVRDNPLENLRYNFPEYLHKFYRWNEVYLGISTKNEEKRRRANFLKDLGNHTSTLKQLVGWINPRDDCKR